MLIGDIRGIYKHFKGGTYEVFGVCSSITTNTKYVLYKPLYNDTGFWLRLYSMFFSKVMIDGEQKDRFAFMSYAGDIITDNEITALHSETNEKIVITQDLPGHFTINY
ncbi:MAG: DUF1653 domain-containing protein [Treponema sp.]|nr:DUF1653 domain-containing protein [Treponema sp.]